MKRSRIVAATVTIMSFMAVILAAELAARSLAPSLPVDPGKWPRAEMAQKLDQMRNYVDDGERFDVVFVGSSMMAEGVDPLAFTERSGIPSYNAAFAGSSMRTISPWTLDIVAPLLDPEVVVIGVQSRELSDNGPQNEKVFEKFITSPGYREATSNLGLQVAGQLERLSYFLGYRRAFREPSGLFGSDEVEGKANRIRLQIGPMGTRQRDPRDFRMPDGFAQMLRRKVLLDFEIGGPEYQALVKLERGLAADGIELVVISMPVTSIYWDAHPSSEDRTTYETALDRFVGETGASLVDAADAFPTDEFRNPLHLDLAAQEQLGWAIADAWEALTSEEGGRFQLACSDGTDCEVRPSGAASLPRR